MNLNQVINDYLNGKSISKLSKELRISEYKLSKMLRGNGIEIRRDNGQKIHLDVTIINDLYNAGATLAEIAKRYNCSDETIRKCITTPRHNHHHKEATIEKIKNACIKKWTEAEYREKVLKATSTSEHLERLRKASRAAYVNRLTDEVKHKLSNSIKLKWKDSSYRTKQSQYFQQRGQHLTQSSIAALKNHSKKANWIDKIRRNSIAKLANQPRISSTQLQLYYLLDRSSIQYHKEGENTRVGEFYVVDCIIPKQQSMKRPLIIEVQGEYWHSLPNVSARDKQKQTYVRKHTDYDLLELSELEFSSFDAVSEKLKSFGLTLHGIHCNVGEIKIKQVTEADVKTFYSTFHYTNTVRKGATTFGAFFNDHLVAAISYTYPIRTQIAKNLNCALAEVMEISRLARATDVVCKNLASFLISKTRSMLNPDVKIVISYSDMTYGHSGTVYKAAGFKMDRVISADYFYKTAAGARFHKKTIWDRAKKMKSNEKEYALKHGLILVPTLEKHRWIYRLKGQL